jgi:hypothetical protein
MKFLLDELNQKSYSDLKLIFLKIPRHQNQVTFQGHFKRFYFSYQHTHYFFSYLPEHIHTIHFNCYDFISEYLTEMVAVLPAWIHTIKMNFTFSTVNHHIWAERNKVIQEIKNYFEKIPQHIQTLDFSSMKLTDNPDDNELILSFIPKHIKKLQLPNIDFGSLLAPTRGRLLDNIPKTIEALSFEDNDIVSDRTKPNLNRIFDSHFPNITSLSLERKDLSFDRNPLYFRSIMSSIAAAMPRIRQLNLRDNNFGILVKEMSFAKCLQVVPSQVMDIDLGKNGIFSHGIIKFCLAFQDLPLSIKAIDLGDDISKLHLNEVQMCIFSLPSQIEILKMTKIPFMGLTADNFSVLIGHIPPHVHTFDISNNQLNTINVHDIVRVFNKIPKHVHTLVLKNNFLSTLSVEHFRTLMQALPRTIKCIDLSENGFESLNHALMNGYFDVIPDVEVVLDFSKVGLSLNQGIVNMTIPSPNVIRPRKLYHQAERAQMLIGLAQISQAKKLPLACVEHIGDYIFGKHRSYSFSARVKHISTQQNVSQQTGQLYRSLDTIAAVRRESAQNFGYSILDYSMMGYFLSDKLQMIDAIKNIPQSIRCVNLSFNRCSYSMESRQRTQEAFQFFPAHVELIDLRGNGFEFMEPVHLQEWLGQIPKDIKILLTKEIPATLTHYLLRMDAPEFYRTMIGNYTKFLDKARILLNDYTQGDSIWMRLLMGYWNRNHIQDVDRVVMKIELGLIQNIRDVFHEFMKISLKNGTGALAKSLMFLILELERAENTDLENKVLMMSRR